MSENGEKERERKSEGGQRTSGRMKLTSKKAWGLLEGSLEIALCGLVEDVECNEF